jgi:catechol 2,3-dioxygenase-like lactoylglutathione lyase family enzyme
MIRNLQHIGLSVPDIEAGRKFYENFGLTALPRGNRLALRCAGRDQDQILLSEGPQRRTHHLSFGTSEAELPNVKVRLESAGVRLMDPPGEGLPTGLWFRDPDGRAVNLQVAEPAPSNGRPGERMNSPGDFRRMAERGVPPRGTRAVPRRLGHVLLFTPSVSRAVAFYTGLLGMRVSDTVNGELIAFLRTAGDSDHHVLALVQSDRPGFHHASFEVGSLDEIVLGAAHLVESGYRSAWGLGRHVIGSNFFHYLRDPWNGLAEYFWDIDFIPDRAAWEVKDWGPEDGFFLWSTGGPPPEDFVINFEAA